jgi:hypothetical protein
MKNFEPAEFNSRLERQIAKIEILRRRRDRILEAPNMDLEVLAVLAADFEADSMLCEAASSKFDVSFHFVRPLAMMNNQSSS